MFDHLAACEYGSDLLRMFIQKMYDQDLFDVLYWSLYVILVDEIQVASYKMLASLYTLGTDASLTHDRKYLKTEIERHKPALVSI